MDFTNDRPIYLQIVDVLQMDMVTGKYKANDKLPSVRELAAQFRVNPNTLQRAFAELENSKLVYTERTNGRFVTADPMRLETLKKHMAMSAVQEFSLYMQTLGIDDEDLIALMKEARKGSKR